ncbi:hypothetical protein [Pseudobacteriovorax antillogorgiicola]|uniref:Uncharacterized protein n=1 Tax=Pseudobacteriovorax antillogorgiicola TaxID=1513793 RepID=A0A1Y6CXW5_9BACT|nr:hypothetical protein [Pseudobacteriovorax antillogorgiicola]TCS42755.1 hypothetical protein EDD56_14023 [Pseudobacteriovorax antillogorgiicola]SMF82269.1 hypothetical protein SAMN06296036_14023 [Pseudobacteriovorax antillogorgiicola]
MSGTTDSEASQITVRPRYEYNDGKLSLKIANILNFQNRRESFAGYHEVVKPDENSSKKTLDYFKNADIGLDMFDGNLWRYNDKIIIVKKVFKGDSSIVLKFCGAETRREAVWACY